MPSVRRLPESAILLWTAAVVILGAAAVVFLHPLVAVLGVAALLVVPFILRDVDLAFVVVLAVIALLPFAAIPLNRGFNPTLLDLALGALYLIWIARHVSREPAVRSPAPLDVAVALLVGLMLVALVAGLRHGLPTANQLRAFGELVLATGLFFIVNDLVTDRRRLRRVFLALVGLGTAAAAIGLALYALPAIRQIQLLSLLRVLDYPSGPAVLRYLNDDPTRLQRATGTSVDPNSFAGMLVLVTALLAPQLVSRAPLLRRRWTAAMTVILCLALVATVSRGALLGLAAAVVVVGLARDRRLLGVGLLVGLGLLGLAQLLPWTSAYVGHFGAGLLAEDRATRMRLGEYKDAVRLIGRYPWLGIGFGQPQDVDLYRGVSSLYLIIAETMGVLGLGVFLGVIGALCAQLALAWRAMGGDGLRAVVLGGLAALCAVLTTGWFDHYVFTYPHAFALLWLIIGLATSASRVAAAEAPGAAAARGPGR